MVLQEELESVQKHTARFLTVNYYYGTGSMTGILGQLKWESLKKRRKDNRLILLYKGLKGKVSVPTDDLSPKTRRCRKLHSMAFQTPIANTDVYKGSFFVQTIRDWNALLDSLISSAEGSCLRVTMEKWVPMFSCVFVTVTVLMKIYVGLDVKTKDYDTL